MLYYNQVIKHKRSMDVAFDIVGILEMPGSFRLSGFWINQAFVKSFRIKHGNIEIQKKDLKHWLYCLTPHDKCIRNSQWAPVVQTK